tara:strand:- start:12670 stop:12900 length:231 start_codon:yes stop_codon:yes gene_type:complete
MKISKKQLNIIILKEFKDTFKPKIIKLDSKDLEELLDVQNIDITNINIDIESAQEYLINKIGKENEINKKTANSFD